MQMEEMRGRARGKTCEVDWSYETSGLNGSSELVGAHLTFSISASLAGLRGNLLLFFPFGTYDSSCLS